MLYIVTLLTELLCRVHLEKCWARIKIARRSTNNLRYTDDTTNGRKLRGTKEPLEGERRE